MICQAIDFINTKYVFLVIVNVEYEAGLTAADDVWPLYSEQLLLGRL